MSEIYSRKATDKGSVKHKEPDLADDVNPQAVPSTTASTQSASSGASILMMGQVFSKIITFTLNQLLNRFQTPTALGLINVIEFTISTILFFSRESIRLTCNQIEISNNSLVQLQNTQLIINLSYISVLIGLIIITPILYLQISNNHIEIIKLKLQENNSIKSIYILLSLIVISIVFELASEPYYNLNQFKLNFVNRTKFESFASFMRCTTQFLTVILLKDSKNIINSTTYLLTFSYCIGQLSYSVTLFLLYFINYYYSNEVKDKEQQIKPIKPTRLSNKKFLIDKSYNYLRNIFIQIILKHLLTEGDKILINSLFSIEEQGYYSMITNYGSLIARIIFAPIEESVRLSITKIFNNLNLKFYEKLNQLNNNLKFIIKFYIYLNNLILIFLPINSNLIISKILLKNFFNSNINNNNSTNILNVFKLYWVLLPIYSINGLTEAIYHSVITNSSELNNYSKIMILNSISFVLISIILINYYKFGIIGLLFANFINMLIRIIYCTWKLSNQRIINIKSLILNKFIKNYGLFEINCIGLFLSQYYIIGLDNLNFKKFFISIFCGLIYTVLVLINERELVINLINRKLKKN